VGDAARGAAGQALHRAAAAAGASVSVETRAPEGDPASRLIAESHDLDLLVVGSRGYGPVRRIVLGTVTAAVLRGAACPVLAVPRCAPVEMDASIANVARGAAR
jgi:nucleotide-binding universal stress UspA family protein